MKALYYVGDKMMEMRDIPIPEAADKEYRIKVRSNGICGSDVEGYFGKTGRRLPPMIMGHEVSGTVETVPPGGKYAVGDRVVIFPKPFCGTCEYCKKGLVNVCPAGLCLGVMDHDGTMTEYVTVEEKYLLPFSNKLSFNEAAMTEPVAVAYRAVEKISDSELADSRYAMVIGCGTIGLLVLALLKLRGAKSVIVCDATDFRLNLAKEMGADHTINPFSVDFIEAVKDITGGKMCDFALEAVGIGPTATQSIDCLRVGGTVVWIGNAQKTIEVNMQKIVTTELTVKGTYVYDYQGFIESLKLLEEKKIDVSRLMTGVYPLGEGVAAFKAFESNKDGKMLKVHLES